MSKKSINIIHPRHPRDVERCEWCGDTIPHRYRGCGGKRNSRPVENKLEHQNVLKDNKFPVNQNIR